MTEFTILLQLMQMYEQFGAEAAQQFINAMSDDDKRLLAEEVAKVVIGSDVVAIMRQFQRLAVSQWN